MKTLRIIPLILSIIFITSCDEALECALGIDPEINESSVDVAFVNEPYLERITAEVDNIANDNSFDYFFEVIGDLPDGIDLVFFAREVQLRGTPLETGSFDFTVFLYVERFEDGYLDVSPTCSDGVSKDFTLFVVE